MAEASAIDSSTVTYFNQSETAAIDHSFNMSSYDVVKIMHKAFVILKSTS